MSLARTAMHGAIWTVGTSMAARVVGLIGTLVITRFLAPEVFGEVTLAVTLVMSASFLTGFGLGNYYIVRGGDPEVGFHMTAYSVLLAAVGLGLAWLVAGPLGALLGVPGVTQYVPGLIAAWAIRRVAALPQKVLVRDLRFRRVGMARAAGELSYVAGAVGLADALGGQAIVIGNVLHAAVEGLLVITGVSWRRWLAPCPLRWDRTRDMFRFGLPLGVNAVVFYVSQNALDRWLYTYFFGPSLMGLYQLGYRLAEIPAAQIGDQVSDVLLPSLTRLEPQARARGVVRSTALLGLVIFPLSLGLAAVAQPLIAALLDPEWHGVAPFVTILSVTSLFHPASSTLASYLLSHSRTFVLLVLESLKVAVMIAGMFAFARFGALWICAGVVAAFALHALACARLCVRWHGVSASGLAEAFVRPLLACVPMIAAVLAVRYGLRAAGVDRPAVSLVFEILAGIAVYIPSAFALAPAIARDFLDLLGRTLSRRS